MSKITETDYQEYSKLIEEGHSQRSACLILGLNRVNVKTVKSKLYYEGKVFPTRDFGDVVVLDYVNGHKVLVKFLETGYETFTSTGHIKEGAIKDKLSPTVCGVGILGDIKEKLEGTDFFAYRAWVGMIERCYSDSNPCHRKTYAGCTVTDNFRYFPYFKDWCNNQIGFGNKGWQLDKDILVKGNKVYGEDTCCFVPPAINGLLIKSNKTRGNFALGVDYEKSVKKFRARCGNKHLGLFNTELEAFYAYKQAKETYIKEVANKWKDQIDPRVYNALMKYEVEITD